VNNTFSVGDVAFKTFVLLPEPGARLQQIAACCAIAVLARRRIRKIAG